MAASKVTRFVVQQQIGVVVIEVVKNVLPLPQEENDQFLRASSSNPSQQDRLRLRIVQGVFQPFVPQIHLAVSSRQTFS